NYYIHETDTCSDETMNRYIADPARWMGGPDPFWCCGDLTPFQRTNVSWYMQDPFNPDFYQNGSLTRYHAYRTDDNYIDTAGRSRTPRSRWRSSQRSAVAVTITPVGAPVAI